MPYTVPSTENTRVALPALPINGHGSEARLLTQACPTRTESAKLPEACLCFIGRGNTNAPRMCCRKIPGVRREATALRHVNWLNKPTGGDVMGSTGTNRENPLSLKRALQPRAVQALGISGISTRSSRSRAASQPEGV